MCIVEVMATLLGITFLIVLLTNKSIPMGAKELRGGPAYLVASLLTAVFPLALLVGCGLGAYMVKTGDDLEDEAIFIDIGAIVLCIVPAIIIGLVAAKPIRKKKKKKKRRPVEDEDLDREDDGYERSRRSRRRDEEEDEEERRPRRRRLVSEDEIEPETPSRPGKDDDDERPRRSRAADDDDDERPRRRRFDGDGSDSRRPRRRRDDDD